MSGALELLGNIVAGVLFERQPKERWKRWLKRGFVAVLAALVVLLVRSEYI